MRHNRRAPSSAVRPENIKGLDYFYKLPDDTDSDRKGIFHYFLFGDKYWIDDRGGGREADGVGCTSSVGGYRSFVADGNIQGLRADGQRQWDYFIYWQATTFMHELGHQLDLDADYLYGDASPYSAVPYDDLPSVMRYHSNYIVNDGEILDIDYSSKIGNILVYNVGNRMISENDGWVYYNANEWGQIDLKAFSPPP